MYIYVYIYIIIWIKKICVYIYIYRLDWAYRTYNQSHHPLTGVIHQVQAIRVLFQTSHKSRDEPNFIVGPCRL